MVCNDKMDVFVEAECSRSGDLGGFKFLDSTMIEGPSRTSYPHFLDDSSSYLRIFLLVVMRKHQRHYLVHVKITGFFIFLILYPREAGMRKRCMWSC